MKTQDYIYQNPAFIRLYSSPSTPVFVKYYSNRLNSGFVAFSWMKFIVNSPVQ